MQAYAIDTDCVRLEGQNSVISFVISKWLIPELSIPAAGQKDCRLWGRESFDNAFIPSVRMLKKPRRMRIFNISAREIGEKLKSHGSVRPPFWILTVEWSGAWSCLFDDATVFSPTTLENSVFEKHRFQIAPLWSAFSNGSVFGDRFRCCSVDDSGIRSKTAPISLQNGLVTTGP